MAWDIIITGLLTVGAVARITRLITTDTITQPLRDWLSRKAAPTNPVTGDDQPRQRGPFLWHYINEWSGCPWCAGMWVSAAAAAAHWAWNDTTLFTYVVFALATSHVIALADAWLDSPPPPKTINLNPAYLDVNLHTQKHQH